MEEEVPLKLIELSDFIRSPSILSERLEFKQTKIEKPEFDAKVKDEYEPDTVKFKHAQTGIILLKQKAICTDNHDDGEYTKQKELIVPKDIVVFADDVDRRKIGLFKKSRNHFSRHLLVTSGAALQALIPSLINTKEWLIVCKLKYSKLYTKETPIEKNVIISLNINHSCVRYEILTAFDLLQQSFNEIKSAYILIDFSKILSRWFKGYLQRTDQYPSLSNRMLYRYQIQASKCSLTLGKRQYHQDKNYYRFGSSLRKFHYKSDIPTQIYINFNSLPIMFYSIQLDNIFVYSMNDEYKQIIKDIGNGLSLVSVHDLNASRYIENKPNDCSVLIPKNEISQGKYSIEEREEIISYPSSFEPNENERILFEKIWNNRMRIQMQHQQLMMKAAKLLCFSPLNNESVYKKTAPLNSESDLPTIPLVHY
ncbi:unnamed protein product [Rotaria magnacalcarata]|uniref:Uncharacterized protein n=1 Tax=Rotaria magnacalcarata TaxID=392030 RepID=A0A814LZ92_9BILA|nr:unnamed protein product [Rotaria magnacalcarata]CAF1686221.1 unnamed protein product [Rotaria magnacalcarata]CAF2036692.1 unnamed protein product [Rotaria magnacalcarata]CAF3806520.1 unnamed protein product [Rotaria magnacalcarata]CAF3935693.1 unnamed protein product [Rotaria magnacalcarata]